ncbi:MAG: hypothetical protein PHI63_01430 [Patescibacteria group bacterium]|nr:hypothetical protein [Patescibacteria group bacterium]
MSVLPTLGIFVLWSLTGFWICRRVLRERRLILLVPLAPLLGMGAFLLAVSILGLIVPWAWANITALALPLAGAAFLPQQKNIPIELGVPRWAAFTAAVATLVLAGYFTVLFSLQHELHFDSYFHFPVIASIAAGNFPPQFPFQTNTPLQYHAGTDMLAASLQTATGIGPWWALHLVTVVGLACALLLAFGLVATITGSAAAGFGGAALLFCGHSVAYLRQLGTHGADAFSFLAQTAHGYGIGLLHPGTALAVPMALAAAYVSGHQPSGFSKRTRTAFIGLMLGQLFLFAEEYGVILALACLIISGWNIMRQKSSVPAALGQIALVFVIAIAVVLVQGGSLGVGVGGSNQRALSQLEFRFPPAFPRWDTTQPAAALPLTDPRAFRFTLEEFGLLLVLLPITLNFLWQRPQPVLRLLAVTAGLSAVLPLFITHPTLDFNLARGFGPLRQFGNLITGAALGATAVSWWKNRRHIWPWIPAVAVTSLVAVYSFGTIAFTLPRLALLSNPGPSLAPRWVTPEEQQVATFARRKIPRNARVLTQNPVAVATLWGRVAPFADWNTFHLFDWKNSDPRYRQLLSAPTVAGLEQLGITHIYVAPEPLYFALDVRLRDELYRTDPRFSLLYRLDSPKGSYRIYAFAPKQAP